MNHSNNHIRINKILLGPLERPALKWLSERMPQWVNPDLLTAFGFFGAVLIFAGYLLTSIDVRFMWLSSFGFVVNWFGDSLDGTLARHRKIERPRYGFFMDHAVDCLTEAMVFIGLGLSPYVDLRLALLALVGYMMLSIYVFLDTYVCGEFRISYLGIGPTEMRVIAIIANTLMLIAGNPKINLPFGQFTLYDLIVMVVAVVLFGAFVVITLIKGHQLSEEDIAVWKKKKSAEEK